MYNRYIPQPDGSFRRSRINNDGAKPAAQFHRTPPPEAKSQPIPEQPRQETCERSSCCPRTRHRSGKPQPNNRSTSSVQAGSFLKNLLPKDFDTSDLIIVLLLLLMAGDCPDDQNTALLTLALYFFM